MAKRYFEEEPKFKPGQISSELRQALGLHEDKLPFWIYRMRVLGYPPGWLKKAQVGKSLNVFEGAVRNPHLEDGEIGHPTDSVRYNPDSFFEYPGFNCPLPPGVRDDWQIFGMPPLMEQQQLKLAIQQLKTPEPVPFKRQKSAAKCNDDEQKKQDNSEELAISTNENLDVIDLISEEGECLSPTRENGETSFKQSSPIPGIIESTPSKELDITLNSIDSIGEVSTDLFASPKDSRESEANTSDCSRRVNLIEFGTPIPMSLKHKKPPLEKWAEGMGPLINFENLPTSTGKFDKMRHVLTKVQKELNH